MRSRPEIIVEVTAVFILAVGLVKVTASIPAWAGYSWILVAAIWLAVTFFILWLNEAEARIYGITLEGWKQGIRMGLLVSLILIPLFWIGCYFYGGDLFSGVLSVAAGPGIRNALALVGRVIWNRFGDCESPVRFGPCGDGWGMEPVQCLSAKPGVRLAACADRRDHRACDFPRAIECGVVHGKGFLGDDTLKI